MKTCSYFWLQVWLSFGPSRNRCVGFKCGGSVRRRSAVVRMPSAVLGHQRCKLQNKPLARPVVNRGRDVRYILQIHSRDALVLSSVGDMIGHVTLVYSAALHWPTVKTVNKATWKRINLPRQWIRNNPRDGISLIHTRCVVCGWISRRLSISEDYMFPFRTDMCVLCENIGVCEECVYVGHDGKRYCGQCELRPGAPFMLWEVTAFCLRYNLYDRIDELQALGYYTVNRQLVRKVLRSWARSRRLNCTAESPLVCTDTSTATCTAMDTLCCREEAFQGILY